MALSIRILRAERLARQVAAESGDSLAEAIVHALKENSSASKDAARMPLRNVSAQSCIPRQGEFSACNLEPGRTGVAGTPKGAWREAVIHRGSNHEVRA